MSSICAMLQEDWEWAEREFFQRDFNRSPVRLIECRTDELRSGLLRMKIGAMKVLIVEDERKTGAYLRKGLSEAGFVSDLADNGEDGLHAAASGHYELIVLDITLPRLDGWSVISRLRE